MKRGKDKQEATTEVTGGVDSRSNSPQAQEARCMTWFCSRQAGPSSHYWRPGSSLRSLSAAMAMFHRDSRIRLVPTLASPAPFLRVCLQLLLSVAAARVATAPPWGMDGPILCRLLEKKIWKIRRSGLWRAHDFAHRRTLRSRFASSWPAILESQRKLRTRL